MSGAQFDRVLEHISQRETYQNRIFLLLCLPAGIPSVLNGFSQFFVSAEPKTWYCDISNSSAFSENVSENISLYNLTKKCGVTYYDEKGIINNYTCNKWIYDKTEFEETLVTKFNLICDRSGWPSFVTSIFYCGSIFGNCFFGWASDKWGRKVTLMPILFLSLAIPFVTTMVNSYKVYGIVRLFAGLLFPALYQVPLILALELYTPTKRTRKGMIMGIWFAISFIITAVIAYFSRTWINFLLISSLPHIFFISYYWLIPESPRWLVSKNRVDEAEIIIQKMAKVNKIDIPQNYLAKMQLEMGLENKREETTKAVTLIEMLKYPKVCLRYIIILCNWATDSLIYHGLTYYSAYLEMNIFVSFGLSGFVEIVACIIAWIGMEYYGMKKMNIACMVVGGLCCIMTAFCEDSVWMYIFLTMVGRLGCSSAFYVFYLYVPELLPTVIRNQAMSTASLVASVIMLSFPYLIEKARDYRELPLIIMGCLSVATACSNILLPETLNCSLPQTLQDANDIPSPVILCRKIPRENKDYKVAPQEEPLNKNKTEEQMSSTEQN